MGSKALRERGFAAEGKGEVWRGAGGYEVEGGPLAGYAKGCFGFGS